MSNSTIPRVSHKNYKVFQGWNYNPGSFEPCVIWHGYLTTILNNMYNFEKGLMADEQKLNEQPSINKDFYYYYYVLYLMPSGMDIWFSPVTSRNSLSKLFAVKSFFRKAVINLWKNTSTICINSIINQIKNSLKIYIVRLPQWGNVKYWCFPFKHYYLKCQHNYTKIYTLQD